MTEDEYTEGSIDPSQPIFQDELPDGGKAEREQLRQWRQRHEAWKASGYMVPASQWDRDRENLTGGTLKLWQQDVVEAEAEVDQALERGDRGAFAEWSQTLSRARDREDKAGDDHVNAQLHRLSGDES